MKVIIGLFNGIWLALGSVFIMIAAGILVVAVRIFKFFNLKIPGMFRDKLCTNSKAHPLPPTLEKH